MMKPNIVFNKISPIFKFQVDNSEKLCKLLGQSTRPVLNDNDVQPNRTQSSTNSDFNCVLLEVSYLFNVFSRTCWKQSDLSSHYSVCMLAWLLDCLFVDSYAHD